MFVCFTFVSSVINLIDANQLILLLVNTQLCSIYYGRKSLIAQAPAAATAKQTWNVDLSLSLHLNSINDHLQTRHRLERLARKKHSNLLRTFVNYGR